MKAALQLTVILSCTNFSSYAQGKHGVCHEVPDTEGATTLSRDAMRSCLHLNVRNTIQLNIEQILNKVRIDSEGKLSVYQFSQIVDGKKYTFDQVYSTSCLRVYSSNKRSYFLLNDKSSIEHLRNVGLRKYIFFNPDYKEIDVASEIIKSKKDTKEYMWRYIVRFQNGLQ